MALEIVEINHVQITVPSSVEEATKHFYGLILGLEEIPKPENLRKRGGAWYRHGSLEVHVSVEDGVTDNRASRRHICYEVNDLDVAERELGEADVEIIPDKQPTKGWRRFYIRDPGGNRIEIAQRT
jgi:catechol 2,3-dioxygenase-like lactoylglutathione lyase family enzyme